MIHDMRQPRGERLLPDACFRRLLRSELIIHAGDLVTIAVLEELQALGPQMVAVYGNVDDPQARAALPERAIVDAGGARIGVIHDAGPARRRLERLRRRFPDADAVVFGHSHIPLHERAPDGFQIFNPGSPTERRRAPAHTMGVARVIEGKIAFRLVELG